MKRPNETYEEWRLRIDRDDVPDPPVIFAGNWARKAIEDLEAERNRYREVLRHLAQDDNAVGRYAQQVLDEFGDD